MSSAAVQGLPLEPIFGHAYLTEIRHTWLSVSRHWVEEVEVHLLT